MVTVKSVAKDSLAVRCGILEGDMIVSVNAHEIEDVLDYRFYTTERTLIIELLRSGQKLSVSLEKDEYEDLGLEFETYLMDGKRRCANGCIFCFIDQNPPGMRDSIYFKDDDERLSFLQGNYITLTNLTARELDRIVDMHISPINVSVHTTDAELRVKMLRNKRAGEIMPLLQRLCDAGIAVNAQIVLCRGWNDGERLEKTLTDLTALFPALQSVAVVPSGLTKHREGLCELEPFDAGSCKETLDIVRSHATRHFAATGHRLFFAADEFYLGAGEPLPGEDEYEGYMQLDNGVGLLTSHRTEFEQALAKLRSRRRGIFRRGVRSDGGVRRCLSIATGAAAFEHISSLCGLAERELPGLRVNVYRIENEFFGSTGTVSGLLTGGDIASQLEGKPLGEALLISRTMLRAQGDLFLDGTTPEWLSQRLGVPVITVGADGAELLRALVPEDLRAHGGKAGHHI